MNDLCNICPRSCGVNREKTTGFCSSTNKVLVSKVMLHFFEEPLISGFDTENKKASGSGTVFFANCTLKCVYCQNSEISSGGNGTEITTTRLAEIFKELEDAGANNINLVSPTHYTNQIIEALEIFKPKIPIVWNTSGYEKPETIEYLKNYVDVFLTDFKYFDQTYSTKYSKAPNYPEFCKQSTLKMREIIPEDIIEDGLMKKGIIIRHLVLPGLTQDSKNIIDWIYQNLGPKTYFSLMSQYVPMGKADSYPEINRKITNLEYKILVKKLNVTPA